MQLRLRLQTAAIAALLALASCNLPTATSSSSVTFKNELNSAIELWVDNQDVTSINSGDSYTSSYPYGDHKVEAKQLFVFEAWGP